LGKNKQQKQVRGLLVYQRAPRSPKIIDVEKTKKKVSRPYVCGTHYIELFIINVAKAAGVLGSIRHTHRTTSQEACLSFSMYYYIDIIV